MIKVRLVLAMALATFAATAAQAQSAYTVEEQQACTGDAMRLCGDVVPDVPRVTACLRAKVSALSPPCAQMFVAGRNRHLDRQ